MSIQWQVYQGGASSADGRFEIEESAGGWQAVRTEGGLTITSPVFGSIEECQGWCEMFILTPADDFDRVQPDVVVVEGVDGERQVISKAEAPEF